MQLVKLYINLKFAKFVDRFLWVYIPGHHLIIRISKKYYYTVSTNNNLFTSKNTAHSEI